MAALYTQEKALSFANVRLEKYAEPDKEFLIGLIGDNLQPNVIYDEALTTKLEQEALSRISLKRGRVQKGELLVRQGAVVHDEGIDRKRDVWGKSVSVRVDIDGRSTSKKKTRYDN